MNEWCSTDGKEPTMKCWVADHPIVEVILYVDGSVTISRSEPLVDMVYSGTPESRTKIQEWMMASAMNPGTPFGYTPGSVLEDGRPGIHIRPGSVVHRDSTGKFWASE